MPIQAPDDCRQELYQKKNKNQYMGILRGRFFDYVDEMIRSGMERGCDWQRT